MLFLANELHGVFVYDYSVVGNEFVWSEKVRDYYDTGDIITVDFDTVIETHFEADFLAGKFTPISLEAHIWAAPLLDLMNSPVRERELAFA